MDKIVKLLVDTYQNRIPTQFTKEQALDVVRQELIEVNGGKEKVTYKDLRENKKIFAILEEALDVLIESGLTNQFDEFVETVTVGLGETKVFTIEEDRLFDVAVISDGNGDLKRDRLDKGEITVKTETMGVAIYEELNRLLAGKVDWVRMVDIVSRSYQNKIQEKIYKAITDSYSKLGATYGITGSYDEAKLTDLIAHVEASTGMKAMILGTKKALSKIAPNATYLADSQKESYSNLMHIGSLYGTPFMELKQAHKAGSKDTFAIDDNFLLVVPQAPDKFIKLILEGESTILEGDGSNRNDMQQEYKFIKKSGIAVVSSSQYGMYKFV